MASWFHCNKCFLRINSSAAAKYVLSNCGHIYCDNCLPTGEPNTCCICRSECTTIALTANLTPDIQIFFANPEESLQKLVKVIEFQKDHGKKLIEHLEKENKILQNKYAHAKEFIKKLHKQHETLQKDHQRLRNILKLSIATSPVPGKNFRTPTGQGSVTSTPATATPTSGHPNRFMWNQSASHMLNKSVSSNQGSSQFRTPSIYQPTPSITSAGSSGSRASQGRGSGVPNGVGFPRNADNSRPRGFNWPGGYNQPSPNRISLDRLSFGSVGRHQKDPLNGKIVRE